MALNSKEAMISSLELCLTALNNRMNPIWCY